LVQEFGLAAAFRLWQAGQPIVVLEQEAPSLVGGRMASIERNGFPVDLGAPLLAVRYKRMLELITAVGPASFAPQVVSSKRTPRPCATEALSRW
jgi:protoporphyrinogen oxidase